MPIDLTQLIVEVDDTSIKVKDKDDGPERPMTLKDVLLKSMLHVKYEPLGKDLMIQQQLSPEEVGKRYDLTKKIRNAETECEFSHDEKSILRTKLSESQHSWVAGQAMKMIE